MLLAAQQRYGIALAESIMVGDSARDILAGKAAGCGRTVLVQTGNGRAAARSLAAADAAPDHIAVDLDQAVKWILADHRSV
jgi:D-glycero-D-manno-heptose 1,7-bisphosphate phosphatase